MKAIVITAYGPPDVLQLRELEKPAPKDNELLIRVHASTVTTGDCEIRSLKFPLWLRLPIRLILGYSKPRGTTIFGMELAGEVEAVGKDVTKFKVGDAVFGSAGLSFGANAEYIALPEEGAVAIKPANMTFEEAATVPFGGRDALHFLRGNVRSGDKVLIVGAGGTIGTYGVQLARHYGAEVTGVDSTGKLDMLRVIGATHVIDYTQQDFTQSGETYDVIFDAVGKSPFSQSMQSLNENGRYILANPKLSAMFRGPWVSRNSSKQVVIGAASGSVEDLGVLRELIEAGKVKAVIDQVFPLEQVVEAHRYVETGQKKGNVVISI